MTDTAINSLLDRLTAAAEAEASTPRTITREDGSTFQSVPGYGSATEGDFQIYVIPAEQRTRRMKAHYRVTFYLRHSADGQFHRVSRAAWVAAAGAQEVK